MHRNIFPSVKSLFARNSLVLVAVVLVLALFVRFWKMEYTPFPNDADELAYIFAGQSVIDFGVPISWSSFVHLDNQWRYQLVSTDAVSEGMHMKFVKPWFDHTFLLPLVMGTWSELAGYDFPSIPPALWYRLPMIALAGVSLGLVFLIGKELFGYWSGMASLVLLGFSPSFAMIQRMVVPENLMTVFMLSAFYLFLKKQPLVYIVMAAVLAGLVKPTGLIIVPILVLGWLLERQYKQAILFALSTLVIVAGSLLWYGVSIDLPAFLSAMRDQSARLVGWVNPAFLLASPGFHTHELMDMSYYLVLFAAIVAWFVPHEHKQARLLFVAILATWCTVWVTSAEQDMLGWYKIPWFSFVGIAAGAVLATQQTRVLCLFLGWALLNNLGIIRYPTHPLPEAQTLRAVVGAFLIAGSLLLTVVVKKDWYTRLLMALVVLYMLQSMYVVHAFFGARCRDKVCPTPLVTTKSVMKNFVLGR